MDSGACASIVGKNSLEKAMVHLKLDVISDASPERAQHRFGDHPESDHILRAVQFPFELQMRKTTVPNNSMYN